MTEPAERPVHSPLGASGAERWINCPGSVELIKNLQLPQSDEPEYRRDGTAAHEASADCLTNGLDAWETIGQKYNDVEVDDLMAEAIQVYLDEAKIVLALPGAIVFIEYGISHPAHPLFYGTVDLAVIAGVRLYVNDYKHGAGIVVEVRDNPQIMYYAYGILKDHPEIEEVVLRIIQPRAFHPDGPVREWIVSADYIREWAENTLIPAMIRTEFEHDLDAGKWCRFCPAKLVCPLMVSLFGAAARANPKEVVELTNTSLGRSYQHISAVKSYIKALEEETFRRLSLGQECPEVKLVNKKADRVFKPEAETVFKGRYGDAAYTEPQLKTPPQMERIDTAAAKLVKEYAYTPVTGLTVALASDKRIGVKVQTTAEVFPNAVETAQE